MFLVVLQILISVSMVTTILLQSQGSGISGTFGGSGEFYRSRRSLEKLLVFLTIGLSVLFAVLSIVLLVTR